MAKEPKTSPVVGSVTLGSSDDRLDVLSRKVDKVIDILENMRRNQLIMNQYNSGRK